MQRLMRAGKKMTKPLTPQVRVLGNYEYFAIVQDKILYILAPKSYAAKEMEILETIYSYGLSEDNVQVWFGEIQEEGPIFDKEKSAHNPEASMASRSLDEIIIQMMPHLIHERHASTGTDVKLDKKMSRDSVIMQLKKRYN